MEFDPGTCVSAEVLTQGRFPSGRGADIVSCGDQPFDLSNGHRRRPLCARGNQEIVQRPAGAVGNQPKGFHRRLGLARLDKVDRGPADIPARDLAKAEAGFEARLLSGSRLDLNANPAPTTARGWATRSGSIPYPIGAHEHIRHDAASLTD
jgi:hypothetical protein